MSQVAVDRPVGLEPLEVLLERAGQAEFGLPGQLAELYGGPLGFREPCLYANFVASVDGVVAIPGEIDSSHAIAAGSQGDRFVMGLLRACADAVLVGAGTLAGSPRTQWTPENAYPPAASLYAELRRLRERSAKPTLAILSGSGRIDASHPGLAERTLVLTSEQGAAQLGDRLPRSATIVPIGDEPPLDPVAAIEALRAGGHELILCEGGPTLFGELAAAGLVDELFLTLSPLLAGRSAADQRLSLGKRVPTQGRDRLQAADATAGGLAPLSPLRASASGPGWRVIAEAVRGATAPSGRQVEIASAEQRAWVVEVGGGLRAYSVRGRELLDGYAADEICSSARGQCLVPWPNRIRDGQYEFAGSSQQLPLTEPERQCAIHGLARWANWTAADQAAAAVTMTHLLHPQPGYPHTLQLAVEYRLDSDGLTVRTTATNIGASACPYGAGAHPYLTLGTPSVDSVVLRSPGRTRLTSDERGIPTGAEPVEGSEYDFRRPRPIGKTKLDTAFADLERDKDGRARVRLASPGGDRATTFWLDESYSYLMLFTGDPLPDVSRRSLGIEPMTCAPNAFRSGDGLVILEPGESLAACWGIEPS